jgi:hypothetical protein
VACFGVVFVLLELLRELDYCGGVVACFDVVFVLLELLRELDYCGGVVACFGVVFVLLELLREFDNVGGVVACNDVSLLLRQHLCARGRQADSGLCTVGTTAGVWWPALVWSLYCCNPETRQITLYNSVPLTQNAFCVSNTSANCRQKYQLFVARITRKGGGGGKGHTNSMSLQKILH